MGGPAWGAAGERLALSECDGGWFWILGVALAVPGPVIFWVLFFLFLF